MDACQNEYQSLPTQLELTKKERAGKTPDECTLEISRRKGKWCTVIHFIGHLFLRGMLPAKIVASVVADLLGMRPDLIRPDVISPRNYADGPPEEHKLELVCELLHEIGHMLDEKVAHDMSLLMRRLLRLQRKHGKSAYKPYIKFQIEGLQELRAKNWVRDECETILTLHAKPAGLDGLVPVLCTTMSGDEVAELTVDPRKPLRAFRTVLASIMHRNVSSLHLMLVDGRVLSAEMGKLPWGKLLECGAAPAESFEDMI